MKPRCDLVGVEKPRPSGQEGGAEPYQSYIGLLAEGSLVLPHRKQPGAGTGSAARKESPAEAGPTLLGTVKKALFGRVRRCRGHLQRTYDRACWHPVRAPRASRRHELAVSPVQAGRWFSAANAKCKRRHLRTRRKMKELMALAAGLPTIFQFGGRVAGGSASYRLYQHETSLEMRRIFTAGRDDE